VSENNSQEVSTQSTDSNTSEAKQYDVIIAGAGISGLLLAHRLCHANADLKVMILERDGRCGGRLGSLDGDHRGHGFNAVTPRLYEFWNQSLKQDPEGDDLPSLVHDRRSKSAILMGNKLSEVPTSQLLSDKGARALGGLAAQRQWPDIQNLFEAEDSFDKTFSDACKAPRKSPAIMVLETYSQSFGITNIWESSPGAIAERGASYSCEPYAGDWKKALSALTNKFEANGQIKIETSARIINADHDGDEWHLQTAKGDFFAERLVVAHPPWLASQWLPKKLWPTQLLTVVNKTKPVSMVTLSTPVVSEHAEELPGLVMIPSEGVQAIVSKNEIVFQATIDYEMSLQAPDVVKAVKRLKRAHRKFAAALPALKMGVERVALVPVGWAQTPNQLERKHLDRLKMDAIQDRHLAFCGDAYGQSLNGDDNLIESVISASEAMST
jgi:glycine/D-amino acid oxidase-like deaminating enzyme